MNAVAARPKTGFKFMLMVKRGPDRGISYQLLPPRVTIGRDASTNVTLNDPRVSRNAAIIEFSIERIVITDTSGRKTLRVNGVATKTSELVDGALIQIGDSQLVFSVEALPLGMAASAPIGAGAPRPLHVVDPQAATAPTGSPGTLGANASNQAMPLGMLGQQDFSRPRGSSSASASPSSQGMSPTFKIVIAIVIGAGLYLGLSSSPKASARRGIATTTDIQKEIDSSEQRQDEISKQRKFHSDEEKTRYEEANRHFLEGFRDYQKGQYSRALRSFETARAIDPSHDLARRYFTLAQKQRDDEVAELILEGRIYKEKQMYTRCSSALEKALDLMSNKDDLKYKQAEATKKECDLLLDNRYQ